MNATATKFTVTGKGKSVTVKAKTIEDAVKKSLAKLESGFCKLTAITNCGEYCGNTSFEIEYTEFGKSLKAKFYARAGDPIQKTEDERSHL